MSKPLIDVIKGLVERIQMNTAARLAFKALKQAFVNAPILAHFDPDKRTIIETNASDWVVAGILLQYHD